jgi:hypothetical protein
MKIENFSKADELARQVKELNKQLDLWEKTDKFSNDMTVSVSGYSDWVRVSTRFIPFETVKLTCIALFKREIELKIKEYEELQ